MKRRDFLTRAPVALAVTAAPAAALRHAGDEVAENPTLLALGAELPNVEKAYQDALAAWMETWRIWSPQYPLAPDPCCNFDWWGSGGQRESDLAGNVIVRPGRERAAKVETIAEMEKIIDWMRAVMAKDDKKKKKASRKIREWWENEMSRCEVGIQLLPGYEAECERIKRESNFDAINKKRIRASDAIFSFARKVLAEKSLTVEGVRIKARAAAAINRLHPYDLKFGDMGMWKHDTNITGLLGAAVLEVI